MIYRNRVMRQLLAIAALLWLPFFATAQSDIDFTADRPGESTGPEVLPKNRVQWETGLGWGQYFGVDDFTVNTTLVRYGITKFAELRVGIDLIYSTFRNGGQSQMGVTALNVGTKIRIMEGEGAKPTLSAMANFACPYIGSKEYVPDHLAPSLYLLFSNVVCDWMSIGYAVGAEWDGASAAPATFWALTLDFAPVEKLGVFVESFNRWYPTKEPLLNSHGVYSIDFGLSYMVHPKVQIDMAAILNLQRPAQQHAISAGVAWQIN